MRGHRALLCNLPCGKCWLKFHMPILKIQEYIDKLNSKISVLLFATEKTAKIRFSLMT